MTFVAVADRHLASRLGASGNDRGSGRTDLDDVKARRDGRSGLRYETGSGSVRRGGRRRLPCWPFHPEEYRCAEEIWPQWHQRAEPRQRSLRDSLAAQFLANSRRIAAKPVYASANALAIFSTRPGLTEMPNIRRLCVYCGSSGAVDRQYREAATELGACLAAGRDRAGLRRRAGRADGSSRRCGFGGRRGGDWNYSIAPARRRVGAFRCDRTGWWSGACTSASV